MKYPISVCSKGRPRALLFDMARTWRLSLTIFVEKDDEAAYRQKGCTIIVLPESGRGLAYSRQQALLWARTNGQQWYWMLDDDIKGFFERDKPLTIRQALERAEERMEREPMLGIAALEYSQFSWCADPGSVTRCGYADCCVLINSTVPANYRTELPLKVDRDFTLSVLSCGYDVIRFRDLSFSVPANGSNIGGLHDEYGKGIEEKASRMMEQFWPGVCRAHTKPSGRRDVKIVWKRLTAPGAAASQLTVTE